MSRHLIHRSACLIVLCAASSLALAPGLAPAKKRSRCAKLHESKGCLLKEAQFIQAGRGLLVPEVVAQANQKRKFFGPAFLYFDGQLQCIELPGEDNATSGRFDLRVNQKPRVGSKQTLTGYPYRNGSLQTNSPFKATAVVTWGARWVKVDLTIVRAATEFDPACTYKYSTTKVKRDH